MHSKIIQVSETPLTNEDWADESLFYDGFQGWIADYVDDEVSSVDREVTIAIFVNGLGENVTLTKDGFILKKGFKREFAEKLLQNLKTVINAMTVDEMNGMGRFILQEILGDTHGYYIYEDGWGAQVETSWLLDAKEETPYYFGAVIDYHF